jgi:hypothetical protein
MAIIILFIIVAVLLKLAILGFGYMKILIPEYIITDNIAGNPHFIDINNGDYHIIADSPCTDMGTGTLSIHDFEGNTIPHSGTNPDIGIYECQSQNSEQ